MKITKANLNNKKVVKIIVGLIHEVFCEFNLKDSKDGLIKKMNSQYGKWYDYNATLSIFQKSPLFFIAKDRDTIIWMIRGTSEKILNLYVLKKRHLQWIGSKLLSTFESAAKKLWSKSLVLKASKYAVPFYLTNGYTIKNDRILTKQL